MAGVTGPQQGGSPPETPRPSIGGEIAAAAQNLLDKTYQKAHIKGDIKITKLNADNYVQWFNNMKLMHSARNVWRLIDGEEPCSSKNLRPKNHKTWKLDDTNARM